jgi:hypothetical protein
MHRIGGVGRAPQVRAPQTTAFHNSVKAAAKITR